MVRAGTERPALSAAMRDLVERAEFAVVNGLDFSLDHRPESMPEDLWPEFREWLIEYFEAHGVSRRWL